MELVIDANILFAAIIKDSLTRKLLFSKNLSLFAPEFLFIEFSKYAELLKEKSQNNDEHLDKLMQIFKRRINIVTFEELTPFVEKAMKISPDINDVQYFALAIKLNIPIWSNNSVFKKQNKVKIFTTSELTKIIL